jgi:hypothetical protein
LRRPQRLDKRGRFRAGKCRGLDFERRVFRRLPGHEIRVTGRFTAIDEDEFLALWPVLRQGLERANGVASRCAGGQIKRQAGSDDLALAIDQGLSGNEDFRHGGQSDKLFSAPDESAGASLAKTKESAKNSSSGK